MRLAVVTLLALLSCKGGSGGSGQDGLTCGNGTLDAGEVCDDGAGNSNVDPNACRLNCTLPICGDGVADDGEACDDANPYGGDGCLADCTVEPGPFESEPNDDWYSAEPLPEGGEVAGAIPLEDRDCYLVAVPENGYIEASIMADSTGSCAESAAIELLAPGNSSRGTMFGDAVYGNGCADLNPSTDIPRFLPAGDYAVCVLGLFDAEVSSYRLQVAVGADTCTLDLTPTEAEDLDLDGVADNCDDDIDGDGITNDLDNCPALSNSSATPPPTPNEDGYIGTWLVLAPFENVVSPNSCLPEYVERLGNDATAQPSIGQVVDGLTWTAAFDPTDRMDFDEWYAGSSTPREIYAVSYIYSADNQTVTLAFGTDDGSRVWWNGTLIHEDSTCHGAAWDQFQYTVDLDRGWNTLNFKIFDGGGGWKVNARFKDGAGDPITDLELSLTPNQSQVFDQIDTDGNGVGDLCENNPVP